MLELRPDLPHFPFLVEEAGISYPVKTAFAAHHVTV
jgi:hypothetical protein